MAAIGIDLGTTNSVVAWTDENGLTVTLASREGGRIIPSTVYFPEKGDLVVGDRAKAMAAVEPERVASLFKRGMGGHTHLEDGKPFVVDGKEWRPEELSSLVLRKLKAIAEEHLGHPVTDAVITVPAYFGEGERAATRDAAELAGLTPLRILNEPTAAAIAHGLDAATDGKKLLVFDLGGGTFDVTIMQVSTGSEMEVLATDGDRRLGGADFDSAILKLMQRFGQGAGVDPLAEPWMRQDAREKAEEMKKEISSAESSIRNLSTGGRPLAFTLTRQEFEAAIEDHITDVADTVERTLAEAALSVQDIDIVLMVGGSSRIPAFKAVLRDLLQREPTFTRNLDEDVARGAAMLAAKLTGSIDPRTDLAQMPLPQDIASHGLGITVVDFADDGSRVRRNSLIIKAGQPIPAFGEEIFITLEDGQEGIAIELNEGNEEDLNFVRALATGQAEFGRQVRQGYPTRIRVAYTADQIVELHAFDGETGTLIGEMRVNREGALSQAEKAKAFRALEDLNLE